MKSWRVKSSQAHENVLVVIMFSAAMGAMNDHYFDFRKHFLKTKRYCNCRNVLAVG